MELNEINSGNMTDKIVESMSRTKDESLHEENSALNENIQSNDREEIEELYEEYMYEGDYEEYRFKYQEYGQERNPANTVIDRSIDETLFKKLLNRKWWLLCIIFALVIGGTVAGLSIHLKETKTRKEPALKEAVLILSTKKSSSVPLVITSSGKSQWVPTLPASVGYRYPGTVPHPFIRVIFIT